MKINFKNFQAQISFDGTRQTFDIAKEVGNMMMYNSSVLLDIGFEDLAKTIYYSEEEVEIPQKYAAAIIQVVKQSNFIVAVKRELINQLTPKK